MVAALSGNGDLSGRSRVPQNDATVNESEVYHAQAVLRDVYILRPSTRVLPDAA